ncbi:MAG: hypothetical protein C0483_10190 [Pirellula sp.]|nr:hypothetical protein [Pirellula sp.]
MPMNPTRRTKLDDLAAIQGLQRRWQDLAPGAQVCERLFELQEFIRQLSQTVQGQADLKLRSARYGACDIMPNESEQNFYGRLRRWMDHELTPAIKREA